MTEPLDESMRITPINPGSNHITLKVELYLRRFGWINLGEYEVPHWSSLVIPDMELKPVDGVVED